jgi:hypothetical protein
LPTYEAERVTTATSIVVEIVRKHRGQVGLAVQPRRNLNRRLAKDDAAGEFVGMPGPQSSARYTIRGSASGSLLRGPVCRFAMLPMLAFSAYPAPFGEFASSIKDVEATIPSAVAFLYAASVMLLTRRLARAP